MGHENKIMQYIESLNKKENLKETVTSPWVIFESINL